MKTLRWVAFLPVAFVACIVAGVIGHYLGGFAGSMFFDEGYWVAWLISGAASGLVFVLVGVKIAPEKTNTVKWILAVIVMLLGAVSAIGSFLGGEDQTAAFAGIAMFLIAIGVMRTPVKDLEVF